MYRRTAMQTNPREFDRAADGLFELQVSRDTISGTPIKPYPTRSGAQVNVAKLPQRVV